MAADDIAPLDAGQATSREAKRTRMEPLRSALVVLRRAPACGGNEDQGNVRFVHFGTCRVGGSVAAYVIYEGEVLDPERYEDYKPKAAASIVAAGGRYLIRGGEVEVLAPAGRTVVLEFSTMQAARAWYGTEEYNEIRKIREGAARVRMYIVDGFA